MFFRCNAIAHLIDYNAVKHKLLQTRGNRAVHVIHFFAITILGWWSDAEPTIPPRDA